MRLRKFDTSKIKVRSSGSSGRSRIPGGRGGGIGIGTLIIVAIAYFVFGADPMQTLSTVQGTPEGAPAQSQQGRLTEEQVCLRGPYATEACNALQSLNETWEPEFALSSRHWIFSRPAASGPMVAAVPRLPPDHSTAPPTWASISTPVSTIS